MPMTAVPGSAEPRRRVLPPVTARAADETAVLPPVRDDQPSDRVPPGYFRDERPGRPAGGERERAHPGTPAGRTRGAGQAGDEPAPPRVPVGLGRGDPAGRSADAGGRTAGPRQDDDDGPDEAGGRRPRG